MTTVDAVSSFAFILLSAALIMLLGALALRSNKGFIHAALRPFIVQAIWIAEKTAAADIETGQKALAGIDKKAFADAIYAAIPVQITLFGISIPVGRVKRFVALPEWESWIQLEYNQMSLQAEMLKAWLLKQAPPAPKIVSGAPVDGPVPGGLKLPPGLPPAGFDPGVG